ncbi:hypothetical protein ACLI4Z_07820 [Natrialbaceae archaeon A-arb3/5]
MTGSLCRRVGPGRLPYASRHDIGAGIAMGATALLAVVLWVATVVVVHITGTATIAPTDLAGFILASSILFAPLTVPSAFLVATALWRYLHSGPPQPALGAILGACTVGGSALGGGFGLGLAIGIGYVHGGSMGPLEAVIFSIGLSVPAALMAVAIAGWVLLPLGAFGGWYHERAKLSEA